LIITLLPVLVNVALLTLLERKVLGLGQMRVGPNKVGAWGSLQPGADAVKLFTNSITVVGPINRVPFFLSPLVSLLLAIVFLRIISAALGGLKNNLRVLFLIMLLRFNVYPLFGAGWSSNSKYAIVGGLRAIAQTVAYEISLSFILLAILIPSFTMRFTRIRNPLRLTPRGTLNSMLVTI